MKSFVIRKKDISRMLKTKASDGKRLLEPLKSVAATNTLPFNILEDKNISNEPEIHTEDGDLWHCLEGRVFFVCGGKITGVKFRKNADGSTNRKEKTGDKISGGTKIVMNLGDWLWIPAGEAHQHSAKGAARLIIIKVPSLKK